MILEKDWLLKTVEYSKNNGWNILANKIFNSDGSRCWDRAVIGIEHKLVDYSEPEGNPNLYQTSGFFVQRKKTWKNIKWDETKLVFADRDGKGYPEDLQYSLDFKKFGYVIHFNENAVVWHNDEKYTEFNNKTLLRETIANEVGFQILFVENKKFAELKGAYEK